jgi:hypothetical protein
VNDRERSLGVYGGEPVMEGHHGRLVYDCQPETADGCVIPVPAGFLGMPRLPEPELGLDLAAEAAIEPEAEL